MKNISSEKNIYATELRTHIKRLRKRGWTYKIIADYLNRNKIRTVQNKRWSVINVYLFGTDRNQQSYRERRRAIR